MPKFSIIIPVYNVAPYLRECLDSVLAQTFTDWEAICVDDGSTDGSGAILDEYREKVEKSGGGGHRTGKFVVIHQKNAGVSIARNFAMDIAAGELISFLDADDVWAPEFLETSINALKQNPSVNVLTCRAKSFAEMEKMNWGKPILENGVRLVANWVDGMPNNFRYTLWGKVFRREVVRTLRFDGDLRIGEDQSFLMRVLIAQKQVLVANAALYGYRVRGGSAMHSAIGLAKVNNMIDWRLDVLNTLKTGTRECARKCAGKYAYDMMIYWRQFATLLPHQERVEALNYFLRKMPELICNPVVPMFARACFAMCRALRCFKSVSFSVWIIHRLKLVHDLT